MITVTYNLAKEDALANYHYETSPSLRRVRRLFPIAVFVLLGGLGLLLMFGGRSQENFALGLTLSISGVVAAIFFPPWYRFALRRSAERQYAETSYAKAFGKFTLSFNEEGITSKSPVGEGKFYWSAVSRVALTPTHLIILLIGPQGFPIPRAQVPDTTIQELKAMVESHIQAK